MTIDNIAKYDMPRLNPFRKPNVSTVMKNEDLSVKKVKNSLNLKNRFLNNI